MRISDQFIERVLSGDGTEEEKRQLAEFFELNPEKLAQYLTDKSWEDFDADARSGAPGHKMRGIIESRVGAIEATADTAPVRRMRYGWIAAASVAVLIGMVSFLYWAADNRNKHNGQQVETAQAPAHKEAQFARVQTIKNESSKARTYSLPDGSTVRLGGNSAVSFNNPWINNRRDITLTGEGVFTVMKDKSKAFTVHSKGIATTALGTVFGVDDKRSMVATVHLYSGRIVVQSEQSQQGKAFKDIYLMPGQLVVFNKENFTVQVKTSEPKESTVRTSVKPLHPQPMKFNKQPLEEIFTALQQEYKVTIKYEPAILKNMDFTGAFDSSKETIESFLSTLCDLNELTLIKINGNSFSIQQK